MPRFRFSILYIILAVWLLVFLRDLVHYQSDTERISYSQFLDFVSRGRISEAMVGSSVIEGKVNNPGKGEPPRFSTLRVDDPDLVKRLTTARIKFSAVQESTVWRDVLSWIVPAAVMIGLWWLILSRISQNSRGGFLSMGKSKAKIYMEKGLKTRFEDVAGVDEAKAELYEIVSFLRDPGHFSKLGGRMPKGVLLVGPPGTGKTLLARAVAGEADVPFFSINGSEFVEMFVGLGAARVRDLFEQARMQAPCIIFIDELDALGKARGLNAITGSANDEKEQTLNQLLAEMDGFDVSKGIIVIGATNRPEVLDPALLRAGRFDKQVLVDRPDRLGRKKILEVHMKKIKVAPDASSDVVASLTAGFSGADLENLVNEAALVATRRGAEAVGARDFTEAIERVVAGLERKNRILNPDEKKRVAYHEMGHTIVALAMNSRGHPTEAVHKVSIIPRGIGALGYTFRRPTEDRYLVNRMELEDKLAVALGGRASEALFFSDISTGAADDLDKATEIARAMITRYGMSDKLGLATFEREPTQLLGSQALMRTHDYSELTARRIDEEVHDILKRALATAEALLRDYRLMMEEGVRALLSKETLDENELKTLWERHQKPRLVAAE